MTKEELGTHTKNVVHSLLSAEPTEQEFRDALDILDLAMFSIMHTLALLDLEKFRRVCYPALEN